MSAAVDTRPTTAADIRDALYKRWPSTEYLTIEEAPDSADRMGRKLDLVAISLWRSRGHELDGVEIKVSVSDWTRELKQAQKADWWWRHVHRFWVAVPVAIAERVKSELPATWGLLSVADGVARQVVKAERHDAEALTWGQSIGLMRASSNAGLLALRREFDRGCQEGERRAAQKLEHTNGDHLLRDKLEALQGHVAAFERAVGIGITDGYWSADSASRIGRVVKAAMANFTDPERTARDLDGLAERLTRTAQEITAVAKEYRS